MQVFHVIRNKPNWLDLDKDYDSHVFNPIVKDKIKKVSRDWNFKINPSYFLFRKKISEIASSNHCLLDVRSFNTALGIEIFLKSVVPPYLVLFSDDDDWYNPYLISIIKNIYKNNPNIDSIIWNHSVFCSNACHFNDFIKEPYIFLNENFNFHTNNYAITNNFFEKLNSDDINLLNYGLDYDLYYGHNNIDKFFKEKMTILKINDYFSMANKNITSYSFWLKNKNIEILYDIIKSCVRCNVKIPSQLKWAEKEVHSMIDLCNTLKFKKYLC